VRLLDVFVLAGLAAAAEQDQEDVALLPVVDPVARAMMDAELREASADWLCVARIASDQSIDTRVDPGRGAWILALKPSKPCVLEVGRDDLHRCQL
jgi:hypothetical protein